MSRVRRSAISVMAAASSAVVSRTPASRHCRTAASQPARLKMNVMAGSSPAVSSRAMTSGRRGARNRAGRRAPRAGRPGRLARGPVVPPGQPEQFRVHPGPPLPVAAARPGLQEQVVEPAADQHVLPQRHRPVLVHDHRGAAAHLGQPVAELLGVADRGGQRDHPDRLRQVDDHFFPDRAAEPVGQVVHLVQDHVAEPGQGGRAAVQHVAQHLGGHHHHRRLAVDAVVPGQQADLARPVAADQVAVLLVGQRLDRRGVEALTPLGQGQVHRELADHRLARPGRRGHQHAVAAVQRLARPALEVVEGEVVQRLEGGELRAILALPAERGVTLRRAGRR